MKLSIALTPTRTVFSPLLFAGDIMRGIRCADELGYDGVEINIRDTKAEPMEEIFGAARSRSLEICAMGTGQAYLMDGLYVLSPDSSVRERLIERLKNHIDWAAKVGAFITMGGVFGRLEAEERVREIQYKGAIDVMRRLADYAAPRGVTLVIEPINRYETNFLTNIEKTMAFIADVDRPSIRLILDTFHMNVEETGFVATIESVSRQLAHVHLVDSNRLSPGSGHINFLPILQKLESIGYSGYLSGEFLPLPDDETAAKRNIEYVTSLLRKMGH